MNEVYIVDYSIATGLGNTLSENWEKLNNGVSAIAEISHFSIDSIDFHKAAVNKSLWENKVQSRICELAGQALEELDTVPDNTFIIWTGVKGNVEMIESEEEMDVPTLPRHFRHWVAERLGINSTGMEINAACASSTVGVAIGAQIISCGECSSVLVVAADIVSRFVHMGFAALRALSPTICRPFDVKNDGLNLGDGAVAILLSNTELVKKNNFDIKAKVSGWGISNDANHITGPDRDGCGLIMAIEKAMTMAKLHPEDVEAFCAHGTGTRYNDSMELSAVKTIFADKKFPIFSIKGAIGHTLGAAGGIEAALCSEALRRKMVPPTVGTNKSETRGEGRIMNISQKFAGNNILTTNSGFGGVNAALILESHK